MRERSYNFDEGPGLAPSSPPAVMPGRDSSMSDRMGMHSVGYGPRAVRPTDLRAMQAALHDRATQTQQESMDDELDMAGGDQDAPTNIYYLAQYMYQISVNAVTMADHELGLLLPRSGRIWFNSHLFTEVPRGRELQQRDAWWRVIDASPSVRFLLGWCVGLYRTARFRNVAHEQLPGWSRVLYFSPTIPDCSRARVKLWSDVVQDVTTLFAPPNRVWNQIQMFTTIRPGDRHWHARLAVAKLSANDDVLPFLGDRNNCPPTLIRRSLDGNPPLRTYEEYLEFTESIMKDLPRLKMQRTVAMRSKIGAGDQKQSSGDHIFARLTGSHKGRWLSDMDDPRQDPSFWQLHL